MSPFAAFFDEVCLLSPDKDHAPLAELLRCIEYNDDDIALSLYEDVRWAVSQWECSVEVRLALIDRLISKFCQTKH